MMAEKRDFDTTVKFIQLYKLHPCLWDFSSRNYKNRQKRDAAYISIIEEMKISGFSVQETKNKIKNLRSTYSQEIKKVQDSKKSGAVLNNVYILNIKWLHEMEEVFAKDLKKQVFENECLKAPSMSRQSPNAAVDHEKASLNPITWNSFVHIESELMEVCRICLVDDVTLYSLQYGQLKQYMDTVLPKNNYSHMEGLPQFVCYECAVYLRKCYSMIKKSETSQAILQRIFAENGEITKLLLKNVNRQNLGLKSRLEAHNITPTYQFDYNFNYEENESCLTNIDYIYDKNENKVAWDTNSDMSTVSDEHDDDDNKQFEDEDDTDVESSKTRNDKKTKWIIKSDTMPMQSDKNDLIESLKEKTIDIKPVRDNILHSEYETDVENSEEYNMLYIEVDSTGLSEESTAENSKYSSTLAENLVKESNVGTKFKTTQRGDIAAKTNKRKESSITKYFNIVKFTTLQEKINEWHKSMENPPWIENKLEANNVYKCEVCSKLFGKLQTYEQHCTFHDPSYGIAECPVCKIRHKSEKSVRKHMNVVHNKKYYCKSCPKNFTTLTAASYHHSYHIGRLYKCVRCSYTSRHNSCLRQHIRDYHSHAFACELCGRVCVSRQGLQQHRDKQHPGQPILEKKNKYTCEECNLSFTTVEALRVHLLTSVQHKELKINSSMRNTCRHCGRQFSSYTDLKKHKRSEHTRSQTDQGIKLSTGYPMDCEHCEEMLQTRRDHFFHMRRQHPDKRYQPIVTAVCEICGKGFQSSASLEVHKLRHSSPKVPCTICKKLFYDRTAMDVHVAGVHRQERPYTCPTCGIGFKTRSNFTRHLKIHTDSIQECFLCDKKFKNEASLKYHVQTASHCHRLMMSPSTKIYKRPSRKRIRNTK